VDGVRAGGGGIQEAKPVIAPECGHAASVEEPKEFLAAVLPFLD
jgi:pimeloyl-ACP methyl ester carboxylesterase